MGYCYYCQDRHDCLRCRAYLGSWLARILNLLIYFGMMLVGVAFLIVVAITVDPYFRYPT